MQKISNKTRMILRLAVACFIVIGTTSLLLLSNNARNEEHVVSEVGDNIVANNDKKIYTIRSSSLTTYELSDSHALAEDSQYIALIKIDSVDGVDNYSEVVKDYVLPYSYGKMTIVYSLVGDLPEDEELVFCRLGGAIDIDKYYNSLSESEKERFDYAKDNDSGLAVADKVQILDENDINIEAGKTYLAYLVDDSVCRNDGKTYSIIGFKGGLREVQLLQDSDVQSYAMTDIKVKNNFTGDWESLSEIVK